MGRNLQHLGVKPLAHLGAAVVHLHRAVLVDQHQRTCLVVEGGREGDAELHWRDGDAALLMGMGGVECPNESPASARTHSYA